MENLAIRLEGDLVALEPLEEGTREGREGVFATRELGGGSLVGSSRYLHVRPADRVVEIGWTWLNPSAWRRGVNGEAKATSARGHRRGVAAGPRQSGTQAAVRKPGLSSGAAPCRPCG